MRLKPWISAGVRLAAATALTMSVSVSDHPLFASEQSTPAAQPAPATQPPPQRPLAVPALPASQAGAGPVLRLSVEEAVTLSLEQNLGIRADRLAPQIADMGIASAASAWTPNVNTRFQSTSVTSPTDSFLSGTPEDAAESDRVFTTVGVSQNLKWFGGNYFVGVDGSRRETNSFFDDRNPRLDSNLNVQLVQPLLRNFSIDSFRQQFLQAQNQRQVADLTLRQTMVTTERNVRNAYWDLVFAVASHRVQVQSLELAQEQLKNNRTRVEVGTLAPIDIIEADAEVARNEEAVIVAEANIKTAEDVLRALVLNPERPDFWQLRIEPTEAPVLQPRTIDVEAAVQAALADRTDLLAARKQVESDEIDVKFFSNQRLPDLNVQFNYSATALGGTLYEQLESFPGPGSFVDRPVVSQRSFASTFGDIFANDFPTWTLQLVVGYPIGRSSAEADLARTRLQRTQSMTNLRNTEMQVVTAVRDIGRRVQTNFQRVEATKKARDFAEQRLSAEQKKFSVGMSDTFRVLQAQRDLAVARNNLLRAILDYNRTLNDFDAIQKAPILGR
ncbi:MAG TPA: TolC family protein [Vicinamibacterales bacterium]|jgi:outer membrane protein TolC|nr:TolC family protein [Vicinamibacterales bacterium]